MVSSIISLLSKNVRRNETQSIDDENDQPTTSICDTDPIEVHDATEAKSMEWSEWPCDAKVSFRRKIYLVICKESETR